MLRASVACQPCGQTFTGAFFLRACLSLRDHVCSAAPSLANFGRGREDEESYQVEIPPELIAKREELEAMMNQIAKASDRATPAMFAHVWKLRKEFDEAVNAFLWALER